MQIRERLREDSAVSPVIGVILMIAITVILAAVIASFVLGLGPTTDTAPAATFSESTTTGGSGNFQDITITLDSTGSEIQQDEIVIKSSDIDSGETGFGSSDNRATWAENKGTTGTISAGDSIELDFSSGTGSYEVQVVYEGSDTSTILETFSN